MTDQHNTESKTEKKPLLDRVLSMTVREMAIMIAAVGILESLFTFAVYFTLGIRVMMALTIYGVAAFIFSAFYLRERSYSWIFSVVLSYILVSVLVVVTRAEWAFGFQNYLFTVLPLCFALVYRHYNFKTVLRYMGITFGLICLAYGAAYWLSSAVMPVTGASQGMMVTVSIINTFFVLSLHFVIFVRLLAGLYQDNEALNVANKLLALQADRDHLTHLYNRRFAEKLLTHLSEEHGESSPESGGEAYCLVLCDVDHFKHFNDTYGHSTGDEVLVYLARIISGNLSHKDYAIRWGGEEFMLIIAHGDLAIAQKVVQRIMTQLCEVPFSDEDRTLNITITAGIARFEPGVDTVEAAIETADRRLYIGKTTGRNRYVCTG